MSTPATPLLMIGTVGTLTVKDGTSYMTWPDRAGLPDGQYPIYAGASQQFTRSNDGIHHENTR
jgi:hypothetical protein